jgi:hypothetical protein
VVDSPIRRPAAALPLFAVLLAGCGGAGDRKPVFPVHGKLLVDNKPAVKAVVCFHPLGPDGPATGPNVLRPQGVVAEDGSFQLTSYDRHDGAPAGKYAVTVIWRTESKTSDDNQQDLLPPRYLHPAASRLTAEVREGPTDLPAFNLSRK